MARVGFIGFGRMGKALMGGFLAKGLIKKDDVIAYDKDISIMKNAGVSTKYSAFEVVEASDAVFICVKPQDMEDVLEEIRDIAGSRLIVSVAAGVSTGRIEERLHEARVIRVMPNAPALINEMAGAFCLGKRALPEDGAYVGGLLNSVGVAYQVDEGLMDAVTGLSGSGPAYVYYMINSFIEAGKSVGLPDDVALNLTLQTVRGAVNMIIASKRDPVDLIEDVASPGGTTIEGLKALDDGKVDEAIMEAVRCAANRSRELGK
jgi:pyrroline-5-carboxylate reductase